MKHFSYRNYIGIPLAAVLNSHYEHNAPLPHSALFLIPFYFQSKSFLVLLVVSLVPEALNLWHTENSQNREISLCTTVIRKYNKCLFHKYIYESQGVFCRSFFPERQQ